MEDKFQKRIYVHMIMLTLNKKDWEFDYEDDGELHFILGNREISTRNMTIEQLDELFGEIINW